MVILEGQEVVQLVAVCPPPLPFWYLENTDSVYESILDSPRIS